MTNVIDVHAYVGRSLNGFEQTVDGLLAEMDRINLPKAILCPVRPEDYAYESQNDAAAEAVAQHPDRFVAMGRVDARQRTAAREVERCLDGLGARGIFLHPWEDCYQASEARLVNPIAEVCQARRVPLMVATGYPWVSEAMQVGTIAGRYPDLPVIMTNGGMINISGLGQMASWMTLQANRNVYITTSGVYREDFLLEVMTMIGAERVLFGSQSPMFDIEHELRRVEWAHTEDAIKAAVLGGNAEHLFGVAAAAGR
jgi:uncharacterized protein